MEVISSHEQIKKDVKSAIKQGIVAGVVVSGYEYYKQKKTLKMPSMLANLEKDIVNTEQTIKAYENEKGLEGLIDKIPKFFTKRELGIKQNMLNKLHQGKISGKAILKSAGFFAIDWAIGSFLIETFLNKLKTKNN